MRGRTTDPRVWADDDRVRKLAWGVAGALAFYFVQQRLWPSPVGVIVQGMIIGGLTALIAFGIALTYRSNRIVNFAAGDLGGLPGAFAVLLIVGPGLPYFLALPIGLVSALVLGAVIEFLVIRRFFKAPRLILTVVTIGLAALLGGLEIALPAAFDIRTPPQSFPSPFDFKFTIGTFVFRGNDVIAMLAVPVAIGALAAFFRFTNVGIAVRASAESADRAALLGIPVKRIQTIVWMISTLLAASAIFLRAGIVGLPIGSVLGPSQLLRALAACVIGRMERLPTIFVAAMAIGILEQSIIWHTSRALLIDPVLFVIVVGALLVQRRRRAARSDPEEAGTWSAARSIRQIPRELASLPEVLWVRRGLQLALLAFMIAVPALFGEGQVVLITTMAIIGLVGISLVVLTGWAGQISLGQMAFLGIGAAVGGHLTADRGWDLSLALIAAGIAGAVAAVLIGIPALRIRGLYLAVTTLAFSLAVSTWFLNPEFVHWLPSGRLERPPLFGRVDVASEERFYMLCLACLVFFVFAVRRVRSSRTGRVLIGVRENERGAQAYGVNATSAKLTAFALSGFLAAFAGGLFVHQQQALGITSYLPQESLNMFVIVVIGGLASVPGVLAATALIRGLVYFSNEFPAEIRPLIQFSVSNVGLIFVLMFLPGGLGAAFAGLRDRYLRWVADRRDLVVPSLVADVATDARPAGDAPPADGERATELVPVSGGVG